VCVCVCVFVCFKDMGYVFKLKSFLICFVCTSHIQTPWVYAPCGPHIQLTNVSRHYSALPYPYSVCRIPYPAFLLTFALIVQIWSCFPPRDCSCFTEKCNIASSIHSADCLTVSSYFFLFLSLSLSVCFHCAHC